MGEHIEDTPEPQDRFVWPPRRDVVQTHSAASTIEPKPTPRASKPALRAPEAIEHPHESWWSQVERVWLSVSSPPLLEQAARAGWIPDRSSDYCQRCGASVQAHQLGQPNQNCQHCQNIKVPWDRLIRLGEYQTPLDRWIRDIKFTRFRAVGHQLGEWLGQSVAAELERLGLTTPIAIVPVPMSPWHRLVRGIDHTTVLARGVRAATGGEIVHALKRSYRPSQLEVLPSDRKANVAGAFKGVPKAGRKLDGRLVVVVDDVTTTGATLWACLRCLKQMRAARGATGGAAGVAVGGRETAGQIWAAVAAWTPEHRRKGPMITGAQE